MLLALLLDNAHYTIPSEKEGGSKQLYSGLVSRRLSSGQ